VSECLIKAAFYRRLTPSSLNHAWLSYQKALKLIGSLPERVSVSRWVADALKNIQSWSFRTRSNERIINARKTVEQRLFNLRHGLTIDGRILPAIDWQTEGTDGLSITQRNVDHVMSTSNNDRAPVEMENAYLHSRERRLTIKKTIDMKGKQTDAAWLATISGLAATPITLELKAVDFDKNYPGHYQRQLKHVSISFVMTSSSGMDVENISAILTQVHSTTLVEPTEEGLGYLYNATKAPPEIKRDLRANQQIALSSQIADDGLGLGKDGWMYELVFHDGRYLPFEGTGAISRWELSFPDAEFARSLISADKKTALVKNIQIHLVYTAVDGGKEFTEKVKAIMPT